MRTRCGSRAAARRDDRWRWLLVGAASGAGWLYDAGCRGRGASCWPTSTRWSGADDLSRLDAAFFTMNGIISIVFFGFVFAERIASGWAR